MFDLRALGELWMRAPPLAKSKSIRFEVGWLRFWRRESEMMDGGLTKGTGTLAYCHSPFISAFSLPFFSFFFFCYFTVKRLRNVSYRLRVA